MVELVIYQRVALTVGSDEADPFTLELPPGPWRPVDEVAADVRALAASGERLVVLEAHRPIACPHLAAIGRVAAEAGISVALAGLPLGVDPAVLHAHGVEILVVPLHGDEGLHDALTAHGAHAATLALLRHPGRLRVRLRVALSRRNLHGIGAAVAASPGAERVTLTGDVPDPLGGAALAGALDEAWHAARGAVVDLALEDAHAPPDTSVGPLREHDRNLETLRLAGGWLPGLQTGVRAPGADDVAATRLHALGMPIAGTPHRLRAAPRVDGTVLVLVPHLADGILALSTLPALVAALRTRGVPARLESVWERPWNLRAPEASGTDPGVTLGQLFSGREGEQQAVARRLSPRLLAQLDLRGVSRVLVPGFEAGAAVRRHPGREPGTVVEIIDLHLLDGLEHWAPDGLGRPGAPWPDPHAFVSSCFPGFLPAYLSQGVPVEALAFRPYPLALEHLPVPRPGGDVILVAGNQRRDHATLAIALRSLPRGHAPVHLVSRQPLPGCTDVVHRGHLAIPELIEAVAEARFVVLPVESHPMDAAGITLAALALALGRPVVGTTAWGLVDHVRHGVSGLLVPPGDADALADAIGRLDGDAGLRAVLGEGATHAGTLLSVQAWADALTTGTAPVWPVRGPVVSPPIAPPPDVR